METISKCTSSKPTHTKHLRYRTLEKVHYHIQSYISHYFWCDV